MEKDVAGNANMLYRTLRKLNKKKGNPIESIKYKRGNVIEEDKIMGRWREYFADLLGTGDERKVEIQEENIEEEEREIERNDVVKVIEKINVGRAPETDQKGED
ncbi:hypothetical protein Zmor_002165 [Zophobas morio]|uniref:Uncharacterized protein n=1 Tax=Zophobas morio TaxID=2755281 RepID=A0AA38J063_9CUCU|nr:hypothetical protein Zmor_002165 [Zophobas morio]